jgi:hypothetical protein
LCGIDYEPSGARLENGFVLQKKTYGISLSSPALYLSLSLSFFLAFFLLFTIFYLLSPSDQAFHFCEGISLKKIIPHAGIEPQHSAQQTRVLPTKPRGLIGGSSVICTSYQD